MDIADGIRLTWYGHSTFVAISPKGKLLLIDPWVQENPACPDNLKKFDKIDLMLITHGHFDHIADAVSLAKKHEPTVVTNFETSVWLQGKGVEKIEGMNKGGTLNWEGIHVTMVYADHSCGILDDGKIIYGGDPCGYVIEFENGYKVYHAGDTNVFGDMRLIGDLYGPDLAILPIGGYYTMAPKEAAVACRFVGAKKVIPMHYGTFPILSGTPDQLRELTSDVPDLEIIAPPVGQ